MARLRPLLIALSLLAPALGGCADPTRTMTPEQLQQEAVRSYPNADKEEVMKASEGALATLGYEVTVVDSDSGAIKTAPKVAVVEGIALQTGDVTSVTTSQNAIGWVLTVTPGEDATTVLAMPRGYANGAPVPDDTRWDTAYMRNLLGALFEEIDSNLPKEGD